MSKDWVIRCKKCQAVTTYSEIEEGGGCPICGGGDFKVIGVPGKNDNEEGMTKVEPPK